MYFFSEKKDPKAYYQKAVGTEPLCKEGAGALEREKAHFYTESQKQTVNEILKLF